jgi:DNA-binding LacI/PurR family transcriptional regulator
VDELLHEKELETQIGVGTFIAERNIGKKLQIYGIVRTLNNPFYGKFADTLGRILEEKNFLTAKIISTQYDPVKEEEIVQSLLKENNVKMVMCGFLSPERYRNALSEAGIGFVEEYVANISPATDRIPEEALGNEMNAILDKFLKCERMPSAVFCTSDFIAVNFISACQMRGLKIPDDFSVCGYDGAFTGYTGAYQISTAIQPLDKLFKKVLNHLASEKTTDFMDLKLPPVLRYGNTVRNLI